MSEPIDLIFYLNNFSNFYLGIYPFFIVLILLGTVVLNEKYKSESYNLLYVFNTAVAWASFLIIFAFAGDMFIAWYGQNQYEWYAFQSPKQPSSYQYFYIKMYLTPLLGLFFFFRRIRRNRFFTLIFLFRLTFGLIEHLLPAFRDYLPSSWSTYYFESFADKAIKYAVIIFFLVIIYLVAKKRNKLPYPSLFLK